MTQCGQQPVKGGDKDQGATFRVAASDPSFALPGFRAIQGEMSRLIRETDWREHALGPRDGWPSALKAAVDVMLSGPIPRLILWGPDLVMLYNDAFREMVGDHHPGMLGRKHDECFWRYRDAIAPIVERVRRGEVVSYREWPFEPNDGASDGVLYLDADYIPIFLDDGTVGGILATIVIRTDAVLAKKALQGNERRLAAAIEAGRGGVFEWSVPASAFAYLSERWLKILGLSEAPVPPEELEAWFEARVHPDDLVTRRTCHAEVVAGLVSACELEYRYRHADGNWIWLREVSNAMKWDMEGRATRLGGIITDVTVRKEAQDRAQYLARHDPLTGLINRRRFFDCLAAAAEEAEDSGAYLGLIVFDFNKFKQVNETLGHAVGDQLLIQIAERLRASVRTDDLAARTGGDDFAVICKNVRDRDELELVARRIGEAQARPFEIEDHLIEMQASLGIVISPDDGADGGTLMRSADLALHHARQRESCIAFFTPAFAEDAMRLSRIEAELRTAIGKDEFEVHYQWQTNLETGRANCVEALVRWCRGDKLIPPNDFIPIAEETGVIRPIGAWIFDEVCRQQASWRRRGHDVTVAINVSPVEVHSVTFLENMERALDRHGVDGATIELEITESVLLDHDQPLVQKFLEVCSRRGIRLAIDDFGIGYSMLGRLATLPAERIKIDRSFIARISEPEGDKLLEAMIDLARRLGKEVVAEGVETTAQLEHLRKLGCNAVQGYLLHRPCPASDVFPRTASVGGGRRTA